MPNTNITNTTWYNQDNTDIADVTSQNNYYCLFIYQKHVTDTNTEISNHDLRFAQHMEYKICVKITLMSKRTHLPSYPNIIDDNLDNIFRLNLLNNFPIKPNI